MGGARRSGDRYAPRIDTPRGAKPAAVDVSNLHSYKNPGDENGNGMYVLYANSEEELLLKMAQARVKREIKYTNTVLPESVA